MWMLVEYSHTKQLMPRIMHGYSRIKQHSTRKLKHSFEHVLFDIGRLRSLEQYRIDKIIERWIDFYY